MVDLLLRRGADPNLQASNGSTALMLAAGNAHADIMCLVVPAGAELRHVELFGNSTAGAPTLASCAPHTQYSPRARPTK